MKNIILMEILHREDGPARIDYFENGKIQKEEYYENGTKTKEIDYF